MKPKKLEQRVTELEKRMDKYDAWLQNTDKPESAFCEYCTCTKRFESKIGPYGLYCSDCNKPIPPSDTVREKAYEIVAFIRGWDMSAHRDEDEIYDGVISLLVRASPSEKKI